MMWLLVIRFVTGVTFLQQFYEVTEITLLWSEQLTYWQWFVTEMVLTILLVILLLPQIFFNEEVCWCLS